MHRLMLTCGRSPRSASFWISMRVCREGHEEEEVLPSDSGRMLVEGWRIRSNVSPLCPQRTYLAMVQARDRRKSEIAT